MVLKVLRKRKNLKRIMWTLAILIIPAFVLWGSGSAIRSRGMPKYAGKIFGKKISFSQYEASFRACRNQALLVYGEDFERVAKFLDLEKEAWERLMLLYQAKKEKMKVPDKEVISFVQKLPLFQKQGRFDQKRYNLLLDYALRTSPREFEEQLRGALAIDKLKAKVINKVSVTDEEVKEVYKNEYEKATAFYVFIDPQNFTNQIHPAYEQLQDYYQERKTQFKKPEQVNVQYIALYFEQARLKLNVSEEEIQNYYSGHPEQFSTKDKKEKVSVKPLEEVKAQIKERLIQDKAEVLLEDKIWQISEEIAGDAVSFEEVAKKNQLEVKETGLFGPQEVIAEIGLSFEFLNTAFSLKTGQVSNVIKTPKGYFIIKVKEKKQAYVPALEEVKEKVEQALIQEKSWQLAESKAEQLLSQIKEIMQQEELDFIKTAEKLSLTVKETEKFTRASYISGIGQSVEFSQAAFALKPGEVSEVTAVPNGYCLLSLKGTVPIDEEKFAEEKEEFAQKLLNRKKDIFYKIWLAKLKKKANLVSNIEGLQSQQAP